MESSLGQRIVALREEQKLTQAELARRIGIAGSSMWLIENGKTLTLRGNTLTHLCEQLHTTAGFLLEGAPVAGDLKLAAMEAELTYSIRVLKPEARIALMEYARYLVAQQPGAAIHRPNIGTISSIRAVPKNKPRR